MYEEQKVRRLLDQVKSFTAELWQMLEESKRIRMGKLADMLLRTAVLNTANEQDPDMLGIEKGRTSGKQIAAATRFKKQGLVLGVLDARSTGFVKRRSISNGKTSGKLKFSSHTLIPRYSAGDITSMKFSSRLLRAPESVDDFSRCTTIYDGVPVLLESCNQSTLDPGATRERLFKVSVFLQDLGPYFHRLSCPGYVRINQRYAYVFDLPVQQRKSSTIPSVSQPTPALPKIRTLHGLLNLAKPSLNICLMLAITVLETLLQLHTARWLHKEFRSENVLFICPPEGTGTSKKDTWRNPVYITGYGSAREDRPNEATEPPQSELEADLYRHPQSMGSSRLSFCKAFDVFSVGCILLEVGLWYSLSAVIKKFGGHSFEADDPKFPSTSKTSPTLIRLRHDVLVQSLRVASALQGQKWQEMVEEIPIMASLSSSAGLAYTLLVAEFLSLSEQASQDASACLLDVEMKCLDQLRAMADVL